jgi:FixJ family two-component response regulator
MVAAGRRYGVRDTLVDRDRAIPPRILERDAATPVVYIVDGDVSVRDSLGMVVRQAGWHPETFASARAFLPYARVNAPSCLVLELALPDLSGLDLQKRLAADRTDIPIIFVTGYSDVPMAVQAMKAGAVEFLIKPLGVERMMTAIRSALDSSRTTMGHEAEMQTLRRCYASLSRREREVMALVTTGLMNKRIGGELGISEVTVKAHRGKAMHKMKAESLAALVTMAARLHGEPAPVG